MPTTFKFPLTQQYSQVWYGIRRPTTWWWPMPQPAAYDISVRAAPQFRPDMGTQDWSPSTNNFRGFTLPHKFLTVSLSGLPAPFSGFNEFGNQPVNLFYQNKSTTNGLDGYVYPNGILYDHWGTHDGTAGSDIYDTVTLGWSAGTLTVRIPEEPDGGIPVGSLVTIGDPVGHWAAIVGTYTVTGAYSYARNLTTNGQIVTLAMPTDPGFPDTGYPVVGYFFDMTDTAYTWGQSYFAAEERVGIADVWYNYAGPYPGTYPNRTGFPYNWSTGIGAPYEGFWTGPNGSYEISWPQFNLSMWNDAQAVGLNLGGHGTALNTWFAIQAQWTVATTEAAWTMSASWGLHTPLPSPDKRPWPDVQVLGGAGVTMPWIFDSILASEWPDAMTFAGSSATVVAISKPDLTYSGGPGVPF